jgi:8-oxo-dGTP diphosphatase
VFFATIVSGEPKCLEHEEIKWITVNEIDGFDFCPADVEIIDKIKLLSKEGKL